MTNKSDGSLVRIPPGAQKSARWFYPSGRWLKKEELQIGVRRCKIAQEFITINALLKA